MREWTSPCHTNYPEFLNAPEVRVRARVKGPVALFLLELLYLPLCNSSYKQQP